MDPTHRVAARYLQAQDEEAFDALVDHWADVFLDELERNTQITESEVDQVLKAQGVSAEDLDIISDEGNKEASNFIRALGGLVLRGVWNTLVHPFLAIGKMIKSPSFRQEVKVSFRRALRHEVRSTKHMISVAGRLARGEEVNPQERKAAMHQLVDILTKAILVYFAGPHIAHLFAGGAWKALAAILSPLDEVLAILLDKPLRAAAKKLLSADIGMLPSGFYTHF
jgi:hypothetical protein